MRPDRAIAIAHHAVIGHRSAPCPTGRLDHAGPDQVCRTNRTSAEQPRRERRHRHAGFSSHHRQRETLLPGELGNRFLCPDQCRTEFVLDDHEIRRLLPGATVGCHRSPLFIHARPFLEPTADSRGHRS